MRAEAECPVQEVLTARWEARGIVTSDWDYVAEPGILEEDDLEAVLVEFEDLMQHHEALLARISALRSARGFARHRQAQLQADMDNLMIAAGEEGTSPAFAQAHPAQIEGEAIGHAGTVSQIPGSTATFTFGPRIRQEQQTFSTSPRTRRRLLEAAQLPHAHPAPVGRGNVDLTTRQYGTRATTGNELLPQRITGYFSTLQRSERR